MAGPKPFAAGNWKMNGDKASLAGVEGHCFGAAQPRPATSPFARPRPHFRCCRRGIAGSECQDRWAGLPQGQIRRPHRGHRGRDDCRRRRHGRHRRPFGAAHRPQRNLTRMFVQRRNRRGGRASSRFSASARPRHSDGAMRPKPSSTGSSPGPSPMGRPPPSWSSPTSRSGPSAPGSHPPSMTSARRTPIGGRDWPKGSEKRGWDTDSSMAVPSSLPTPSRSWRSTVLTGLSSVARASKPLIFLRLSPRAGDRGATTVGLASPGSIVYKARGLRNRTE